MWRDSRHARSRCSPTRWSSTSATWSRRWPARSGRRTASRSTNAKAAFARRHGQRSSARPASSASAYTVEGANFDLGHGDVVIAAITSCTNTSNPSVLIGAGLLARNAVAKGLQAEAVGEDLAGAGLAGRHRVSARRPACRPTSTRSASTSSATAAPPASAIPGRCRSRSRRRSTTTTSWPCSVLSGNRNFEGRVNPDVRANYLASPPLVVAYALAGSMLVDLDAPSRSAPAATASRSTCATSGRPTGRCRSSSTATSPASCSRRRYADVFKGDENWQAVDGRRPARPTTGTSARPTCRTRPISRA